MQKVAASAGEFDLSFEWLGAYIATISEVTRQAPEVVGTALNRMFSRLRNVRQTGYNQDDDTKINDIAKALNEVDIELFDQGNWRNIADILSDIAYKWNDLTDKQQSYIATTMAGVQSQTMFNALMGDMANVVNGTSRAFELYEGAMNSAGTAAEKYGVWQESVAAAQGNMQASLEQLYSLLNADWMKSIYDWLAGFIDLITAGISAGDGAIVKFTAMAAGAGALAVAISKVVKVVGELRKADSIGKGFLSLLGGSKLSLVIAGIGALASVITLITGAVSKANEYEPIDYSSSISQMENYIGTVQPLADELEELASKASLSADEQTRANEIMSTLSGTSSRLKTALDDGKGGFVNLNTAVTNLNEDLLEAETRLRNLQIADALQAVQHVDSSVGDSIRSALGTVEDYRADQILVDLYDQFMQEHPTGIYSVGGLSHETFGSWLNRTISSASDFGYSAEDISAASNRLTELLGYSPSSPWIDDDRAARETQNYIENIEFSTDALSGAIENLRNTVNTQYEEALRLAALNLEANGLPSYIAEAAAQSGTTLFNDYIEAIMAGTRDASDADIGQFGIEVANTVQKFGQELADFLGG